ncbi:Hypothetical predicted protein [Octopus vulgaris]|uniref:Uncharacterized protein n=1 Tax=Octopus vulgaris TaxID=6645 RepID=A0AA36BCA6_OCTVU|nr:Hypothetical predicted protein [Octopus vulgaris]
MTQIASIVQSNSPNVGMSTAEAKHVASIHWFVAIILEFIHCEVHQRVVVVGRGAASSGTHSGEIHERKAEAMMNIEKKEQVKKKISRLSEKSEIWFTCGNRNIVHHKHLQSEGGVGCGVAVVVNDIDLIVTAVAVVTCSSNGWRGCDLFSQYGRQLVING